MNQMFIALIEDGVRRGASDIHLSSEANAYARVSGDLAVLSERRYAAEEIETMMQELLSAGQWEALQANGAVDVAFSLSGERFRGHVYKEKVGLALAARKLEGSFRSLENLGLPPVISELARLREGLVLFTGPTGSGKSTTLATLIDQINRDRACHILTIEDPIEYVHANRQSLVHQRELLRDVSTFAEAVRSSLREDPDVLLVGEMRDVETMRAAITVAETGHLVFSTLHCGNAVGALDRLIGAFDANERDSLCQQLSMVLRAVVAQHLLPRRDGNGRIPSVEILKVNRAVANLIRTHKPEQIYTAMENGGQEGMQTLEASLAELAGRGMISANVAKATTENPRLLEQRLQLVKDHQRTIHARKGAL